MRILSRVGLTLILTPWLWAQTSQPTVAAPVDKTVEVSPSQSWTDSGIDLHPGDVIEISATTTGTGSGPCDPQGLTNVPNAGKLPLESALPASLLAKLKEKSEAPLYVGAARNLKITEAGRLYFGSNLGAPAVCTGKYSVKIHITPGAGTEAASMKSKLASAAQIWMNGQFGGVKTSTTQDQGMASDATLPSPAPASGTADANATAKTLAVSRAPLDEKFAKDLQTLPRRVNDEFKNLGDMVNFVLIGSEKQVQDALAVANWHVADTSTSGAVARAILMATQKQDYLQMPMSPLYLFGRVQDFGYEQAEPYAMVASRHHFRIWKATVTYQGLPVWAGAGTHDIGFEKDQRNGQVTHMIDPMVDGERDHIGESLQLAGQVRMMNYFTPTDSIQNARNATGGGYQSDGRVLVVLLQ
jgi:LssY-like putative type I secretion system component LssY